MYISESNLRKIVRKELLKEGIFDDIVNWAAQNTPHGIMVKAAHDFYYDTLGGDIEAGRLPWENSHTDIIKLPYRGVCFFGPNEKNAVPASLIGKMSEENNFIVLVDPKAEIPPEQEGWFKEKRRDSSHAKYVWNAMKKLKPDVTDNAWTKEGGIKDQLAKGNVYYAATSTFLYYPLSDDEKEGLYKFVRETGIESGAAISGMAAAALAAVGAGPLAAAVEAVGNGFNVADIFNKLAANPPNFVGAAFAILGLVPGGDMIGFLNKIGKLEDTFPASLADDIAREIVKLLEGDFKNTVTEIVNAFIEDRDMNAKQVNPLIQGIEKGAQDIADKFASMAKKGNVKVKKA